MMNLWLRRATPRLEFAMPFEGLRQSLSRLAKMDRRELLDRSRQEVGKRSDAILSRFGFTFSQALLHTQNLQRGRFVFTPGSVKSVLKLLRQHLPQQAEQVVLAADKRFAHAQTEQWIVGETFNLFAGTHYGYCRRESPVVHRRSIFSLKCGLFLVRDVALGIGKHRLDISWHLGPELRLRAEHLYQIKGSSGGLAVVCADKHGWSEEVRKDVWSPAYGKKQAITVLNFGTFADLPAEFVTLLIPLDEVRPIPGRLVKMKAQAARINTYVYSTPRDDFSFFFAEERPWIQGKLSSDAEFVCWQRKHDSEDQLLIFCNGSYVEVDGQRVVNCNRKITRCEMLIRDGHKIVHASEPEALAEVS